MICPLCEESIKPGEARAPWIGTNVHLECGARSVIGSVGHQMKWCSCFGGDKEDPPGMTKRQAAIAAFELMGKLHDIPTWAWGLYRQEVDPPT